MEDHLADANWLRTPTGDPRGYIDAEKLTELWFHTGTNCNLRCPFCLEGSKPGDNRLNKIAFADAQPFIDEALALGVEKFSFTGGEPFVVHDLIPILDYALDRRPCLVLTNGTNPLLKKLPAIEALGAKPNPLAFRISLDSPDPAAHDAARGEGNFAKALATLGRLHRLGFKVSIARHRGDDEDVAAVDALYREHCTTVGVPGDVNIVSFPDFLAPGSIADVPHVTEDCMTRYHTAETRSAFMCHYSRMVVKQDDRMRVYACTLVDDSSEYDLGGTLADSLAVRVRLGHHRCYSCFAGGASCSEA